MTKYNIKYLMKKGFDFKEFSIENRRIYIDVNNLISYVEVEDDEEVENIRKIIVKEYPKIEYIWIYNPTKHKLKVFRKIGEIRQFVYSDNMGAERKKSKEYKLKKFSPNNMDILFDIKDVMDKFYNQLWEHRLKMANSITSPLKDTDKLFIVQHFIDRLVFFYFLAHLGIILVKYGSGTELIEKTLDKTETREFFKHLIELLSDSELQKLLNSIFFEGLGNRYKINGKCYVNVQRNVGGFKFIISVPCLNCGLYREREFEDREGNKIKETDISFGGIKNLIETLNKYNWVIGECDEEADNEDTIGSLTPKIIGHVYEKFVVGLENIGEDIKLDELKYEKGIIKYGRKKLGAFYTPEEITKYISENTIIPYLFDKLKVSSQYDDFNEFVKSASPELLKKSLEVLNDIKILDPACGSGHFLVSAGVLLFNIKNNICEELMKKDDSFSRKYDAYDEVKTIIMDNLYGVDICENAVEIAKLRLWLWLVSQLKDDSSELEPLPNLEYNIRCGNSLIGWIDDEIKPHTLEYNTDKIDRIFKDLIASSESIEDKNELKRVQDLLKSMNENFLDNYVEALHILYRNYRVSSGYRATQLKEILEDVREAIYDGVNHEFLNYINDKIKGKNKIRDDVFESLNPLHWRVDFGWIIKNGGFDIVIGNPPYGNILKNVEKQIIEKIIGYYVFQSDSNGKGSKNAAALFINLGANLLKLNGYLGFIVPKSICYIEEWEKTRKLLLEKVNLKRVVDNSKAFEDVKLEMTTIIFKKDVAISPYVIVHKLYLGNLAKYSSNPIKISKKHYLSPKRFITDFDETKMSIYLNIISKSVKLWDIAENYRGLNLNKYVKDEKLEDDDIPIIRGKDIKRFGIKGHGYIKKSHLQLGDFSQGEVIAQRIIAHIGKPIPHIKIMATLPPNFLNVNTVTNIKLKEKAFELGISPKYLVAILNSKIINWFVYKYIYVNAIRSMDFVGKYADETPILIPPNKNYAKVIEQIVEYISFLECIEGNDDIKDFLKQMLDTLIYFGYTESFNDLNQIVDKLNEIIIPLNEKNLLGDSVNIITKFYKNAKKELGDVIADTNMELMNLGIL